MTLSSSGLYGDNNRLKHSLDRKKLIDDAQGMVGPIAGPAREQKQKSRQEKYSSSIIIIIIWKREEKEKLSSFFGVDFILYLLS